jgi:uncharacterized membrane protein
MLAFVITINIFLLAFGVLLAFFAGFLLRSSRLRSQREKIQELEQEMLDNHAKILELEMEKGILKKKLEQRPEGSATHQS